VSDAPKIDRVRHELKRRLLDVIRVEHPSSTLIRVVLGGEQVNGFTSLGFDDHVKLIFPGAAAGEIEMRDFTPRHFDAKAQQLWIDFYVHDGGPATSWAKQARPGQTLTVGGPKGSAIVAFEGIDTHVLIGDETALPAICRRLEELPASTRAVVMIETDREATLPPMSSAAAFEVKRVDRASAHGAPAQELIAALQSMTLPQGAAFYWIAVESHAARALRRHLTGERGVDKRWIKAAGYWQRGSTGTHDSIRDDD
jgi:NADPH-dependent ferric siderophore reductase